LYSHACFAGEKLNHSTFQPFCESAGLSKGFSFSSFRNHTECMIILNVTEYFSRICFCSSDSYVFYNDIPRCSFNALFLTRFALQRGPRGTVDILYPIPPAPPTLGQSAGGSVSRSVVPRLRRRHGGIYPSRLKLPRQKMYDNATNTLR